MLDPTAAVVTAGIEPIQRLPARLDSCRKKRGRRHSPWPGDERPGGRGRAPDDRLPIHLVDEYGTSRAARALYFSEHPPRGWRPWFRRLSDTRRPIDDYAAILIARRFLARGAEARSPSQKPPRKAAVREVVARQVVNGNLPNGSRSVGSSRLLWQPQRSRRRFALL